MSARLIVTAVSLSLALVVPAQAQRIDDRAVCGVLQRADLSNPRCASFSALK